jgi:uncharacterized membrane protein YphA (DoxX/SURF4 family)
MRAIMKKERNYNENNWRLRIYRSSIAARVVIGGFFCASGGMKMMNQSEFVKALNSYSLFSESSVDLLSLTVPQAEIIIGVMFALGIKTRLISWGLAAMIACFTTAASVALINGQAVDCGCFPTAGETEAIGLAYFARNALLIASCLGVGAISQKRNSFNQQWTNSLASL